MTEQELDHFVAMLGIFERQYPEMWHITDVVKGLLNEQGRTLKGEDNVVLIKPEDTS